MSDLSDSMIRESLRIIELDSVTGIIEFLASYDSVTSDLDDSTNELIINQLTQSWNRVHFSEPDPNPTIFNPNPTRTRRSSTRTRPEPEVYISVDTV